MTIISFIENVQKLFDEFHIYTLLMEFQADKSSNLVSNAFENIEKNKQALETWLKQNNSSVTQADIDSFETEFRVGVLNDIRTSTPYAFPRNGLSASVEFRKHFLLEYENNVLAWTLAWCYEKYELLLKKIFIQCENDIFNNKISDKDAELILKGTKYDLKTLHNYFIKNFQEIGNVEANNSLTPKYNYSWYVFFIEKIRHIIVHKQGHLEDLANFKKKVTQQLGLVNNDKFGAFLEQMIYSYFSFEDVNNPIIFLTSRSIDKTIPQKTTNKYECLIQFLVNHAFLIVNCIRSFLEKPKT